MKRFFSFTFVALILLCIIPSSCALPTNDDNGPCPKCLIINVDDSFPDAQQKMIRKSMETWQDKTDHTLMLYFQFKPASEMDHNYEHPGQVNIFNATPPDGYWGWTWHVNDAAQIKLLNSLSDDVFLPTVEHEMGHAWGLPHYYGPYHSIMGVPPYHVNQITCTDIIDFCDIWKCQTNCDPSQD